MSQQLIVQQVSKMAALFDIPDSEELVNVLKGTAFKGQVSDAQMSALLIVANQYKLNPWTKEIYAFPDKNNGIVPVVGVDGWSRIINEHQQFDGVEFEYGPEINNAAAHEWIECILYRKDRTRPVKVREFFREVYRDNAQPWKSHPKRMHRHKALIQCARLAFGFAGIYDQDEAERIVEKDMGPADVVRQVETASRGPKPYPEEEFKANVAKWGKAIIDGRITIEGVIAKAKLKGEFTEDQLQRLKNEANPIEGSATSVDETEA